MSNRHPSDPRSDRTSTGTHEGWLTTRPDSRSTAPVDALVVAWSLVEPERAAEVASIRASTGHFLTTPPGMSATRTEPAKGAVVESQPSPRAIREALARHAGNQSKAYAELRLPSRFAPYRLLRKHGIDPRDPERER